MEPQMIDHYNEMPSGVNVIDKLNEENDELQKENEKLQKENKKHDQMMKKFQMPRIKVDTSEEYTEIYKKIEVFGDFIDGLDYEELKNKSDIIVNKLDELTNHKNKEWCEYRVYITIAENEDPSSEIVAGDWLINPERTPSYEDACIVYEPEWSNRGQNINLWNMCYYHCEKCNKLDDYGEPEMYGNQLLCIDCLD